MVILQTHLIQNVNFQKEVKTRISYIVDALGKMEEVLKRQAELDARQAAKKEQETTRRVRKISGSESGSDRGKADKRESSVKKTSKKKPKRVRLNFFWLIQVLLRFANSVFFKASNENL